MCWRSGAARHHRGGDVGRHRRRGDRGVQGPEAGRHGHPLPAWPGERGPAPADDDRGGRQRPRRRAWKGDFDDCQALVKAMFNHHAFRDELGLSGVNSINWARIVAQVVYYFTAAVSLGSPHRPVSFSVPTGNFGDVLAGWVAKRMGLPVARLNVATNANDILARTIATGALRDHRRGADHLAVHGHPGLLELRAAAVRGLWPGRRGHQAADGLARSVEGLRDRGRSARRDPPRVLRRGGRRKRGGRRDGRHVEARRLPARPPHRHRRGRRAQAAGGRPGDAGRGARHRASRQVPRRGEGRDGRASATPRPPGGSPRAQGAFHGAAQRPRRGRALRAQPRPGRQEPRGRTARARERRHEFLAPRSAAQQGRGRRARVAARGSREGHHAAERPRVVTEAMPQLATAALGVWIGAGTRHEKEGEQGSRTCWSTWRSRARGGAIRWPSSRRSSRSAAT